MQYCETTMPAPKGLRLRKASRIIKLYTSFVELETAFFSISFFITLNRINEEINAMVLCFLTLHQPYWRYNVCISLGNSTCGSAALCYWSTAWKTSHCSSVELSRVFLRVHSDKLNSTELNSTQLILNCSECRKLTKTELSQLSWVELSFFVCS